MQKQCLQKALGAKAIKHTMHMAIDLQRAFCDPRYKVAENRGNEHTNRMASKVRSLLPHFRRANLKNCFVYYGKKNQTYKTAGGGLHNVKPKSNEMVVRKGLNSAFEDSGLSIKLKRDGVKNILITGVNLNACVHLTALDAVFSDFNVWVLPDCVANDNENEQALESSIIEDLEENGIQMVTSLDVLENI